MTSSCRAKERLEAELRAAAQQRQRAVHHWRLQLLSHSFILWQDFSSKEREKLFSLQPSQLSFKGRVVWHFTPDVSAGALLHNISRSWSPQNGSNF